MHLTQVKGIGVWTAHMFLIFALQRPDILATGDLGVRMAIRKAYQLGELPHAQAGGGTGGRVAAVFLGRGMVFVAQPGWRRASVSHFRFLTVVIEQIRPRSRTLERG